MGGRKDNLGGKLFSLKGLTLRGEFGIIWPKVGKVEVNLKMIKETGNERER